MDQTKISAELCNDVSLELTGREPQSPIPANDIRALNDLELVLASGGDGIPCW
jgi:hypothetical protein